MIKNGMHLANGTFMKSETSNRLKAARKAKGFSQRDMANKLGCGLRTYSRYETFEAALPERRLALVASILQVSENWLTGGSFYDRYDIPSDIQPKWDRIQELRGAVTEGYVPKQWDVNMERVMEAAGYHPDLNEDDAARLMQTPDSYLNVRIASEMRDRVHEVAALAGVSVQEIVRLSWLVFEEALSENGY